MESNNLLNLYFGQYNSQRQNDNVNLSEMVRGAIQLKQGTDDQTYKYAALKQDNSQFDKNNELAKDNFRVNEITARANIEAQRHALEHEGDKIGIAQEELKIAQGEYARNGQVWARNSEGVTKLVERGKVGEGWRLPTEADRQDEMTARKYVAERIADAERWIESKPHYQAMTAEEKQREMTKTIYNFIADGAKGNRQLQYLLDKTEFGTKVLGGMQLETPKQRVAPNPVDMVTNPILKTFEEHPALKYVPFFPVQYARGGSLLAQAMYGTNSTNAGIDKYNIGTMPAWKASQNMQKMAGIPSSYDRNVGEHMSIIKAFNNGYMAGNSQGE